MNEFTKETEFDVNSCDARGRIKPSAYFNIFQNAPSLHADKLGVGFDELIKRDIVWMLIRCRYDVIRSPAFEQKGKIKTYPLPPRGIEFDREYLITDLSGETLVKGTSKWCLCNYKTRKLVVHGDVNYNNSEYVGDRQYENGLKKISDFSTDDFKTFVSRTYFTDLDHNGHVNNTRYLDFILNAIHEEITKDIKYLEIDYISEMVCGEEFTIYYGKTGDEILVKCHSLGKEVFRAKVGLSREGIEPH